MKTISISLKKNEKVYFLGDFHLGSLDKSESIFLTINNKLCSSNDIISKIYKDHKNEDGFLYVIYSSENTFG